MRLMMIIMTGTNLTGLGNTSLLLSEYRLLDVLCKQVLAKLPHAA